MAARISRDTDKETSSGRREECLAFICFFLGRLVTGGDGGAERDDSDSDSEELDDELDEDLDEPEELDEEEDESDELEAWRLRLGPRLSLVGLFPTSASAATLSSNP